MTLAEMESAIERIDEKTDRMLGVMGALLRAIDASGQLLRSREAAELLGMSRSTLHRLTVTGEVPYLRVGRLVLYSRGDLEEWIDEKKRRVS